MVEMPMPNQLRHGAFPYALLYQAVQEQLAVRRKRCTTETMEWA